MENKKTKRYLTGDRPTGHLHLGHYAGSLLNRVDLQNKGYEGFIIIADYQVLTDRFETRDVEQNIFELVRDYVAVGIEPKKTPIFIQSQIAELAELTMCLSMITIVSQIERNPTVKEEARAMGVDSKMSVGMFMYPVSQAADILLFQADFVPVGEDQAPHIELTRDIAARFNRVFGDVFKIPEIMLSKYPRLLGLDGDQKMSKSRGNAVNLCDDSKTVLNKIKKAVTDSGSTVEYDLEKKPEISNLLTLFSIATNRSEIEIAKDFSGKGYGYFKIALAYAISKFLEPIREKRASLSDDEIKKILITGAEKAREIGVQTMRDVRSAMKFDYDRIFQK